MAENFGKVIHPYNIKYNYQKRSFPVFITIKFENGELNITGVEGPLPSGNCKGGCGQIDIGFDYHNIDHYAKDWDVKMLSKLLKIWDQWHLNYRHAECEHQESKGYNYNNCPDNERVCSVCGYKIGSAWTKREVPEDILIWLKILPDSDKIPAWH
jgi:hypothetical protein